MSGSRHFEDISSFDDDTDTDSDSNSESSSLAHSNKVVSAPPVAQDASTKLWDFSISDDDNKSSSP